METLNYKVLAETGYNGYILKDAPVKVMQFGEGNFLRAFVDYFYDIANEKAGYNGKVKLVQPIGNFPQMADWINEQEGLYTLYLRGSEKGQKVDAKRVISCVSDCVCPYQDGKWAEVLELARSEDLEIIVSNTTEAGIAYTQGDSEFDQVPPNSFPAKLTRVLYERYKAFNGAADKGLVILSCELIDNNGKELKKCCNNYAKDWNLEPAFIDWMNNANTFCSTLVDASFRAASAIPRNWLPWKRPTATMMLFWTSAKSSASGSSRALPVWRTSSRSRRLASTSWSCRTLPLTRSARSAS